MAKSRRSDTPSVATPIFSLRTLEQVLGQNLVEAHARYGDLTAREREVAGLMADGLPNRLIAERLGISPKTLDIHRANVMRKLTAKTPATVANVVGLLRLVDEALAG